jgi:hypothetical protein
MNTKSYLTFNLLMVISISVFSQVSMVKTNSFAFDPGGKIYNKHTGKKIGDEEFLRFIQVNPKVNFEYEINKYGRVEKYLLDTANRNSRIDYKMEEIGSEEVFPEFVFQTLGGAKLKSSELLGHWVILRFENFLKMDSLSIKAFDQLMSRSQKKDNVYAISCFQEPKEEIIKRLEISSNTNVHIVPESYFFFIRYKIALIPTKLPTTIILDPKGKVFKYYYGLDKIDLNFLY